MKRWFSSRTALLLILAFLVAALPDTAAMAWDTGANYRMEILPDDCAETWQTSPRDVHDPSWYTEDAVYARLMAMRSSYPEGMSWTNDNYYGNIYRWYGDDGWYYEHLRYTGYGCAGFALIMSDAAFGTDMPIWEDYDVSFSRVRVGDILRINNDSHSVIILQVNSNSVTVAEGNFNRSIHWGRTLSASQVDNADYMLTRWPGVPEPPDTFTVSYDANGGTGAPAAQTKEQGTPLTLSGGRPARDGWYFLGWAENADAETADYQPGDAYTVDADTTLYAVWAAPDFVLPASLTEIQAEAFAGCAFRFVKLSEQTERIGSGAFSGCEHLRYIYIPAATESIDPGAFGGTTGEVTIIGHPGTAAETFALEYGFPFIPAS